MFPFFSKRKKPTYDFRYTALAYTIGAFGSWVYEQSSGAATALHEIVGHGKLGIGPISSKGDRPHYWISGFDKLHQMQHAHSPGSAISHFFNWFFAPQPSKDGAIGTTQHGKIHSNTLGNHLGPHASSAWISIAGSIPGLLVDTSAVVAAMLVRKKHTNIAISLATFGITNSLVESTYAWSAAVMTPGQMRTAAANGHDFANFAVQMSAMSGLSASSIACATAFFWTGFIPLVALGIYFYQKSHQTDIVPNHMALAQWLLDDEKHETEFRKLYLAYFKKEYPQSNAKPQISGYDADFIAYLIREIPDSELRASKEAILQQWQALQNPSKLEKYLSYAMMSLIILGMIEQILALFAHTIAPALLPAVTVFQIVLPFLGVISVGAAGYETYKDFQCPATQISPSVKAISLLKLMLTTTMVTCMMVAIFMPGLQFAFFAVALIGTLLTLGLSFAKIKMLQTTFAETPPNVIKQKEATVLPSAACQLELDTYDPLAVSV